MDNHGYQDGRMYSAREGWILHGKLPQYSQRQMLNIFLYLVIWVVLSNEDFNCSIQFPSSIICLYVTLGTIL